MTDRGWSWLGAAKPDRGRPFAAAPATDPAAPAIPPPAFRRRALPPQCLRPNGLRAYSAFLAKVLVVTAVVTAMVIAIVYYNRFVSLEQDIGEAKAQIDRELQRRSDLVHNLVPAVFEYADLERHVFTEVAKVRTDLLGRLSSQLPASVRGLPGAGEPGAPGAAESPAAPGLPAGLGTAGADQLGDILGRLVALSEQYPDMKASSPFELLMEKLTETEDRLATARQAYNELVNDYTTLAGSFPGAVFARLFGFERTKPFFAVEADARATPVVEHPPRRSP